MFYFEGSFSFWGELLGFIMKVEVLVIEPDLTVTSKTLSMLILNSSV